MRGFFVRLERYGLTSKSEMCFFFQVILMKNIIGDSLLLVMILGELQKKLNRQMPDPTYAIFFKRMPNMTFPCVNPIQLGPAHSTRPHHLKKALYVIFSGEIPEIWVCKSP